MAVCMTPSSVMVKVLFMRLLHVLVYLAGTDIAVLEAAKI